MNAIAQEASPVLELQPLPGAQVPALQQTAAVALQPRAAVTPADLLQVAMEAGDKDIERLERLMQMNLRYRELQQQEIKRAEEIAFEAAFVGFTGENIIVPKTKHVDRGRGGSFAQAEFDVACNLIKPALAKHGFGIRHKEEFGSKTETRNGEEVRTPWVWVVCILTHRAGGRDELALDGPADTQSVNSPTQNAQSTCTYLKRQSMLAITGTPTGGEDDEAKHARQQKGEAESEHGEELRAAGRAAALEGMKKLTAWWGSLTDTDRAELSKDFGDMRKAARRADGEAQ
ncbi:hypothetical protein SAMN05216359_105323 [Roseateles sp. YR242]|uniref:ERF family protein n=1 Tax=Roseateles sp. YR242 TaxID=1855305 RepID=UPI0008B20168|nr:ERF family protein [Roseateles sp. YR242]SEL13450.1 hypothetical protein SAMN05216359_105323 [Roseateles sp. YR242]